MFECGPEGCPWNGEHTFIRKDPIEIIKSLIQCNVDTFSLDDRVDRDYLDDIRGGSLYRNAKAEMRRKLPNAKMVGIILAVDDTNLTNHSGSHIGRPLYMTTTNLPLETRRQINNFAWRPIGFLPHMKSSGTMTNVDKAWKVHAKAKFASVVIERVLAPLKDARRAGFEVCPYIFIYVMLIYRLVPRKAAISGADLLPDRFSGSLEDLVSQITSMSRMYCQERSHESQS